MGALAILGDGRGGVSGAAPFVAYAVINDGAGPGLGTGDGSYVPMSIPEVPGARR